MMVDRNLPQELTDLDSFLDVLAAKVADRIAPSQPHPGWTEPFPLEWSLEANGGGTLTSGAVRLTYFTAKKSETRHKRNQNEGKLAALRQQKGKP